MIDLEALYKDASQQSHGAALQAIYAAGAASVAPSVWSPGRPPADLASLQASLLAAESALAALQQQQAAP